MQVVSTRFPTVTRAKLQAGGSPNRSANGRKREPINLIGRTGLLADYLFPSTGRGPGARDFLLAKTLATIPLPLMADEACQLLGIETPLVDVLDWLPDVQVSWLL